MRYKAIFIGGVLPAILLGVCTLLMKNSAKTGISTSMYLLLVGATVGVLGLLGTLISGEFAVSFRGAASAIGMAMAWTCAIACMVYGFSTLKLPVSQVAPLTNCSALITVTIGALVFGEWRDLQMVRVVGGTLLIGAGATLVSLAR